MKRKKKKTSQKDNKKTNDELTDQNSNIVDENTLKQKDDINEQDERKKKFLNFFKPILKKEPENTISNIENEIKRELESYLKEPVVDIAYDPMQWWKSRAKIIKLV